MLSSSNQHAVAAGGQPFGLCPFGSLASVAPDISFKRREIFLAEMEQVVPWDALLALPVP